MFASKNISYKLHCTKNKILFKDLVKFTEEMFNGKNLIFCTVQEICFKENLSEIITLKLK